MVRITEMPAWAKNHVSFSTCVMISLFLLVSIIDRTATNMNEQHRGHFCIHILHEESLMFYVNTTFESDYSSSFTCSACATKKDNPG